MCGAWIRREHLELGERRSARVRFDRDWRVREDHLGGRVVTLDQDEADSDAEPIANKPGVRDARVELEPVHELLGVLSVEVRADPELGA